MAKTSMKIKQQRPAKFSTREYNRCRICGRPHAYLRKYGICRVCFRTQDVTSVVDHTPTSVSLVFAVSASVSSLTRAKFRA